MNLKSKSFKDFVQNWLLAIIEFLLIILSILGLIFILIQACTLKFDFSPKGFQHFIQLYSTYSILFAATFVVVNIQLAIRRQKITVDENNRKLEAEENNTSLLQCEYFLNDIQEAFREFLATGLYSGMSIQWDLVDISRPGLKSKYPHYFERFEKNMDTATLHKSLILLYKVEAFSAIFLHGIADKNLGKKVIGQIYCRQIAMLMGLIAYLRTDPQLFQNILELYHKWNDYPSNSEAFFKGVVNE